MPRIRRVMKPAAVLDMAHLNFPSFMRQREHVAWLDSWHRAKIDRSSRDSDGNQEGPYAPRDVNDEYKDLETRSPTPWLGLVVTNTAQNLFLDGVRRPGTKNNLEAWSTWQENGWDARQGALYRAALAHGLAYATALPGKSRVTGNSTAVMRGVSARKMAAFYDDDGEDEFPRFAMRCELQQTLDGSGNVDKEWLVRLYDETATHYLAAKGDGFDRGDWRYISYDEHGLGVTPVVRYARMIDLDGRATGEVEPFIPLAKRIDQDTFDRLIVQRFGAWKVRWIAGMVKPEGGTEAERAKALELKVQDILISGSAETKFGTLDATDLSGFISARDSDIRDLAAVSQTPPHHLLGLSDNLSAEALAAAQDQSERKGFECRVNFGESHEQLLRLTAYIRGNKEEATAFDMEARWRDTTPRSLAQTADALGKLATMVKVPVEMLWEKIPGWTDTDIARAKELLGSGAIDALAEELIKQAGGNPDGPPADQPPVAA